LIDGFYAPGFQSHQVAIKVIGSVGDVVKALTMSLQKPANPRIRIEWFHELQTTYEGHADSVFR
tara:strand:+ start:280 stop:471 length:192 start_codon:yes stop_codon:yes gene_type:complete